MKKMNAIWLLPVLVALAVHLPGLFCNFVYDDVPLIVEHPRLASPAFAGELWQRDYGLEFARQPLGFYRPAFMTLVHLLRITTGTHPFPFHAVGLVLLCIATALVTLVTARWSTRLPQLAPVAGLIYAVHPARVETATMVMSWPDLLIEIGGLGLLLLVAPRPLKAPADAPLPPARAIPVAALGVMIGIVAALTKESAYFIYPALILTAAIAARRAPARARSRVHALAAGVAAGLALALVPRHLAAVTAPRPLAATLRDLMGIQSAATLETLAQAVREVIVPAPAVFWRHVIAPGAPLAAAGLVLVLAVIGTIWALNLRCGRQPAALLTAWIGSNTVTLMLLAAGNYPYAQRYLAVAPWVIGLCLAAGAAYPRLRTAHPALARAPLALALAIYLAAHAAYAVAGSCTCLTPLAFFTAMQIANPRAVVPLGALAQTLNKSGPPGPVESCVRQATRLDPAHPQVPLLHTMLIKRYLNDGRFADALRCSDWSLSILPEQPDVLALQAAALASLGRHADALAAIDDALAASPTNPAYATLRGQIAAHLDATTSPDNVEQAPDD